MSPSAPLQGQVALVTGGGRGIGRTLALGLARAGADVAVVARTAIEVKTTARKVTELGRRGLAIVADVASETAACRAVTSCAEEFGPPGIVVNAAAVQGPIGRFDGLRPHDWARAVQVNLLGLAYVTHAALQYMVAAQRGKIVNLSGGGAAAPRPYFSAYGASKAAAVRFTETLAEELREVNVQVNAIGPGVTRTRMIREVLEAGENAGSRERGEAEAVWESGGTAPEKQVDLTVFLAGEDSNHVTGRFLHVNDPWRELLAGGVVPDDLFMLRRVGPVELAARSAGEVRP